MDILTWIVLGLPAAVLVILVLLAIYLAGETYLGQDVSTFDRRKRLRKMIGDTILVGSLAAAYFFSNRRDSIDTFIVQKLLTSLAVAFWSCLWVPPLLLLVAGSAILLWVRASRVQEAVGLSEDEIDVWVHKRWGFIVLCLFVLAILYTTAIIYMKFY